MSEPPATFSSVMSRTWRDNMLFSVLVELTYRCNLDCFFCYNDLGLRGKALSTPQLQTFFRDLADLGVLNLTLSGGEPLAHPDFFLLGRTARELGFVVRVKSNGHALRTTLARRLRDEVDPYIVEVSLHGACAETHDRQTRVPGSFARLLENLAGLRELGQRVKINSTLTVWNQAEVEGMYAIADRLDMRLQIDPEVTPRDDGSREPLSIAPTADGVLGLFRVEFARSQAAAPTARSEGDAAAAVGQRDTDLAMGAAPAGKHCGAGSSGIAVDPHGNVYPCVQWRRPVGNLHESGIAEIWAKSRGLADIRELTAKIKQELSGEPDAPLFNFCPGLAETSTGDARTIYHGARQRAEAVRTVMGEAPARTTSGLRVIS